MAEHISISYDPAEGIIHQVMHGPIDAGDAETIDSKTHACVEQMPDPSVVRICIDGRGVAKANSAARKILMRNLQRENVKKIAVWGVQPFARAFMHFFSIASGTHKLRTFARKEEALAWLRDIHEP